MRIKSTAPSVNNDVTGPFNDLWNLRDQMNRFFENTPFGGPFSGSRGFLPDFRAQAPSLLDTLNAGFPSLNVSESEKRLTIKAELPGLDERDITIETNRNQLTIRGEKKEEREEEDGKYYLKEISSGKFSRSITLPFEIDPNDAKASFSNGLLNITIRKPAELVSQTRTIAIKNNNSR